MAASLRNGEFIYYYLISLVHFSGGPDACIIRNSFHLLGLRTFWPSFEIKSSIDQKNIDKHPHIRYTLFCVKRRTCDSGVVGNARPCQGRDRGFEPRLSLGKQIPRNVDFTAFLGLFNFRCKKSASKMRILS